MKEEIYYEIQTEEPFCIDVPYLPLHRKKSWKCEESSMDEISGAKFVHLEIWRAIFDCFFSKGGKISSPALCRDFT